MPIGYLIGMLLGLFLGGSIGWRGVFYITGALGIVVAAVIFFGVREPPRGQSEPELAELEHISAYRFNWETARGLFQKRTLRILFVQGFFGVFPWNVITYWFFNYLETERGYSQDAVFMTMVLAVLVLAAGYPLGGALGDYFFKRTPRGPGLVAMTGVLSGAVMLTITLSVPNENQVLFAALLAADRHLHPDGCTQRRRHGVRCHPARSAQHCPVCAIFHRIFWSRPGAGHRRPDRRSDLTEDCLLAHLRYHLDSCAASSSPWLPASSPRMYTLCATRCASAPRMRKPSPPRLSADQTGCAISSSNSLSRG